MDDDTSTPSTDDLWADLDEVDKQAVGEDLAEHHHHRDGGAGAGAGAGLEARLRVLVRRHHRRAVARRRRRRDVINTTTRSPCQKEGQEVGSHQATGSAGSRKRETSLNKDEHAGKGEGGGGEGEEGEASHQQDQEESPEGQEVATLPVPLPLPLPVPGTKNDDDEDDDEQGEHGDGGAAFGPKNSGSAALGKDKLPAIDNGPFSLGIDNGPFSLEIDKHGDPSKSPASFIFRPYGAAPGQASLPAVTAERGVNSSDDGTHKCGDGLSSSTGIFSATKTHIGHGNKDGGAGNNGQTEKAVDYNGAPQKQPSATSKVLSMFATSNDKSAFFPPTGATPATEQDKVNLVPSAHKTPDVTISSQTKPRSTPPTYHGPPDSARYIPFRPPFEPDGNWGGSGLRLCHLNFTNPFRSFSPEEVRLADYHRGNRPSNSTSTSTAAIPIAITSSQAPFSARKDAIAKPAAFGPNKNNNNNKTAEVLSVTKPQSPTSRVGAFDSHDVVLGGQGGGAPEFPPRVSSASQPEAAIAARPSPNKRQREQVSPNHDSKKKQGDLVTCRKCGNIMKRALIDTSLCQFHSGKPKLPRPLWIILFTLSNLTIIS